MVALRIKSSFIHLHRLNYSISIAGKLPFVSLRKESGMGGGGMSHWESTASQPPIGICIYCFLRCSEHSIPARLLVPCVRSKVTESKKRPSIFHQVAPAEKWRSQLQPKSPGSKSPCSFHCLTLHSRDFKHCLQENMSFGSQLFLTCLFGWSRHSLFCLPRNYYFFNLVRVFWLPFKMDVGYLSALGFRLSETIRQVFLPSLVPGMDMWPKFCNLSLSLPRVWSLSGEAKEWERAGAKAS